MKKIILILLTFLLSFTLISCANKATSLNDKLIELADEFTNNEYKDYQIKVIHICEHTKYDDNERIIFSYEVRNDKITGSVGVFTVTGQVLESYVVDKYNFPYFRFLPYRVLDASQLWFYYENGKLYDLNEAYEKGFFKGKEGILVEALRRYLRSLNHTDEEIQLFMKSTENILSQKKIIEEKISNSYSKVIKDYDDSYVIQSRITALNEQEITPITDDYVARFFSYYPIYKYYDVIKNEETIGKIIITSGFALNPNFKKTTLYERPLYVMAYISNDDEIKGLYVIDHGIEDYPFDEDFDFGFTGKTSKDFKEQSIEASNFEYDEDYIEIYQEVYKLMKVILGHMSYMRGHIPEF